VDIKECVASESNKIQKGFEFKKTDLVTTASDIKLLF